MEKQLPGIVKLTVTDGIERLFPVIPDPELGIRRVQSQSFGREPGKFLHGMTHGKSLQCILVALVPAILIFIGIIQANRLGFPCLTLETQRINVITHVIHEEQIPFQLHRLLVMPDSPTIIPYHEIQACDLQVKSGLILQILFFFKSRFILRHRFIKLLSNKITVSPSLHPSQLSFMRLDWNCPVHQEKEHGNRQENVYLLFSHFQQHFICNTSGIYCM